MQPQGDGLPKEEQEEPLLLGEGVGMKKELERSAQQEEESVEGEEERVEEEEER